MTMMVAELPAPGAALRITRREIPNAGPGQALVRIDACGVCGSDVFLQDGGFGDAVPYPIIPGHEAAGTVVSLGPGVDAVAVGDQVAIYYVDCPPDSSYRRRGLENLHPGMERMGVDVDGAFAQYVVRPVHTLIPTTTRVDPAALAVLTDAVATPFHAITKRAKVRAGETVAVIGIGGLGSNAVQIGKMLGARVIAVSRSRDKLELARSLGAEETVVGDENVLENVRRLTEGAGPEVVIQCVGSASQDELAIAMAAPGGRVAFIGADTEPFKVRAIDLSWKELTLLGSCRFTSDDIREVVDLFVEGTITVDHLLVGKRPLSEANQSLDDLRHGRTLRSILIP